MISSWIVSTFRLLNSRRISGCNISCRPDCWQSSAFSMMHTSMSFWMLPDFSAEISGAPHQCSGSRKLLKVLQQRTSVHHAPTGFWSLLRRLAARAHEGNCRESDLDFRSRRESLGHIAETGASLQRISVSPDFTPLLPAVRIEEFRPYENKICIVPNYRMG